MEDCKKKIFVLLPALSGHINPIVGMIDHLISTHNDVQVYFYSTEQFRSMIEQTGATYRPYSDFPRIQAPSKKETVNLLPVAQRKMVQFAHKSMPGLLQDIDRDKPDLILYDLLSLHAKLLLKVLEKRYKRDPTTTKPPRSIQMCPAFTGEIGIYPNDEEMNLLKGNMDKWFLYELLLLFWYQAVFSWTYGIDIINTIKFTFGNEFRDLVITTVFPQLQPRQELLNPDTFRFVGCCIDEKSRNYSITDPKLQQVLDEFQPVNPLPLPVDLSASRKRLVYVSLGTVFNDNKVIYDKIINGIVKYQEQYGKFELKVVFSLGEAVLKEYEQEGFKVPENFVFQKSVPQIELLKRASLFITHCGMNSCSETVHYGVPIIGIPMDIDQPLNALRLCDQLKLGVRINNPLQPDENDICRAVDNVLSDDEFLKRVITYSSYSRKYDGKINGGNEIWKYLTKE